MAALSDFTGPDRHEKLRLLEEREREHRQARFDAAHDRGMRTRSAFAESNPNSVSPQEYAAMMKWRHDQGLTGRERELRQFEMNMLKQQGDNEFRVAEQKRLGMENQGLGAAEANGAWGLKTEEARGRSALSQEEKKWAGQREIADIGLKQHELEWGNGGGRERIARIEGGSRVDAARAQAEAAAEQQAQKNALEEQKRIAAAEKEKGRLKLQYDKLDQKDRAAVDSAANSLAKEKGISFEDARAQVMAGREQSQQGGNITTDSTGKKWEIVRDANGKPIGKRAVQ